MNSLVTRCLDIKACQCFGTKPRRKLVTVCWFAARPPGRGAAQLGIKFSAPQSSRGRSGCGWRGTARPGRSLAEQRPVVVHFPSQSRREATLPGRLPVSLAVWPQVCSSYARCGRGELPRSRCGPGVMVVLARSPGCPSRHEPARSQVFRIPADNFPNELARVCDSVGKSPRSRCGLSFSRLSRPAHSETDCGGRRRSGGVASPFVANLCFSGRALGFVGRP